MSIGKIVSHSQAKNEIEETHTTLLILKHSIIQMCNITVTILILFIIQQISEF